MNDLLEKTIRENKQALEDDAPLGHLERFKAKMDKELKHQKRFSLKIYVQVAASLIFVLLLGNQIRMYLVPEQSKATATLASVSKEYGEVEFYFTSAIDQSMIEWNKLNEEGFISKTDQQMMTNEIKEFDQMQTQLQQELESNPDDERVINAMLEYYQAKLSVITLIIDKLEEVKQQKLTNNETKI